MLDRSERAASILEAVSMRSSSFFGLKSSTTTQRSARAERAWASLGSEMLEPARSADRTPVNHLTMFEDVVLAVSGPP